MYASPITLTDKTIQTKKYTKNTTIEKLKQALRVYYRKQNYHVEKIEQEIKKALPFPTNNKDLNDNTRIDSLPWRQLKTIPKAMEDNYKEVPKFAKYSEKDEKLLIRLREA